MDDLVTWLRAQLDAFEQMIDPGESPHGACALAGLHLTVAEARADIDAKRRIIDEYEQARAYYDKHKSAPAGEVTGLLTAIKLLARPYDGREGWRAEWAA